MKSFQYFAHRPPSPTTLLHDPLPAEVLNRISRFGKRWPKHPLLGRRRRSRGLAS